MTLAIDWPHGPGDRVAPSPWRKCPPLASCTCDRQTPPPSACAPPWQLPPDVPRAALEDEGARRVSMNGSVLVPILAKKRGAGLSLGNALPPTAPTGSAPSHTCAGRRAVALPPGMQRDTAAHRR